MNADKNWARVRPLGASLLGALMLSACGGGGSAADPLPATANAIPTTVTTGGEASLSAAITVSGRVMNVGYLGNTQVCFDQNDDGQCNSGEPSTVSNAQGQYTLTVPYGQRGGSLLALVRPESVDSASTTSAPIAFTQGWTWPALLEYADGASTVTANISPITATYYARVRRSPRGRLATQIAMFTRIVYETNVNVATGQLILPVDFDYVASNASTPRNDLLARIKSLGTVLSARANATTQPAPLDMLTTTAMMNAWYNTYTAPTATSVGVPVDAVKIATLTGNNTPKFYQDNDYRYFRPKTDAAVRLRDGISETAGFKRVAGTGRITEFLRSATTLSNGSIVYKLAQMVDATLAALSDAQLEALTDGGWEPVTSDEGSYFTLTPQGNLTWNSGTTYLEPRVITQADGNRVTFRMPGSQSRMALDIADSPATNFQIEEWVGEQRDYKVYYNGAAPSTAPLATAPTACNKQYSGAPQAGKNTNASTGAGTGTTAAEWFITCFDYYTAEYYDLVRHDLQLRGVDPKVAGGDFYDGTLYDPWVVLSARQSCGTQANPLPKITTLGHSHCAWAVDAQSGHQWADLFVASGVALNSWTKNYGTTSVTTGTGSTAVTNSRTAGLPAQAGLPQQLKLTLNRVGSEASGTGTLYSEYETWTGTRYEPVSEPITWTISPENPQMVLIAWPFRDVDNPRVKSNTTSGGDATKPPVLPAHFIANFNATTFSVDPSTHTLPNYRKLAIVLQDGAFVVGQYYGPGYTYDERHFVASAMNKGLAALRYVYAKLFDAGFKDQ